MLWYLSHYKRDTEGIRIVFPYYMLSLLALSSCAVRLQFASSTRSYKGLDVARKLQIAPCQRSKGYCFGLLLQAGLSLSCLFTASVAAETARRKPVGELAMSGRGNLWNIKFLYLVALKFLAGQLLKFS